MSTTQTIRHQAGSYTITLSPLVVAGTTVFRVETTTGSGAVVDAWTRSYPSEAEARYAARHAARVFEVHTDPEAVERRKAELAAVIAEQESRKARRMHSPAVLDAAEAEYDTLATLTELGAMPALIADVTDFLARAA